MPGECKTAAREIFVVDDEAAVRGGLAAVLSLEGYEVASFAEGGSFLAAARTRTPDCVILDVHMPGRSGLDILKELNAENYPVPIFIISGLGDIPMAVEAIKNGAFDFIEKPFDAKTVVTRVREAIEAWSRRGVAAERPPVLPEHFPGQELLTRRERDVLEHVIAGASNKEAGRELGISPRTIEVHRARLLEKLGARNAVELVRILLEGRSA